MPFATSDSTQSLKPPAKPYQQLLVGTVLGLSAYVLLKLFLEVNAALSFSMAIIYVIVTVFLFVGGLIWNRKNIAKTLSVQTIWLQGTAVSLTAAVYGSDFAQKLINGEDLDKVATFSTIMLAVLAILALVEQVYPLASAPAGKSDQELLNMQNRLSGLRVLLLLFGTALTLVLPAVLVAWYTCCFPWS